MADSKFDTLERLIKNGSISLYEALALLDWGKIEVTQAPIRVAPIEPEKPKQYVVAYTGIDGGDTFIVYDSLYNARTGYNYSSGARERLLAEIIEYEKT